MKIRNPSRIIAILAILSGCLWIVEAFVIPIWDMFTEKTVWSDWLIACIMFPAMALPGALAVYYGTGLLKVKSKKNIKGSIGTLSVLGAFLLASVIYIFLPDEYEGILPISIALLLVIPIYLVLSKYAIQAIIRETTGYMDIIGKNILLLLSFGVYFILDDIVEEYAPTKEGYDYVKKEPWESLGIIGPLLAAWVFYRIAYTFIKKNDTEDGASSDATVHQE